MKNILKTAILALAMTGASFTAMAEASKLAVVDMQVVMNETSVAKDKQNELREQGQQAQKRLMEMDETLNKRVSDLNSKKSILSEDKYKEEQAELRKMNQEFQAEAQQIQEKLSVEHQRVQAEIADAVDEIVTKISKERGFDVVLAKSYALYASKGVDITEDVLNSLEKHLKAKSKKKGL